MKYNIKTVKTQEFIKQFLKGELEPKDREDFLVAIATDKILAKEVAINEAIILQNTQPDLVKMKSVLTGIAAANSLSPNLEVDLSEFESINTSSSTKRAHKSDVATPKPTGSKWIMGSLITGIGIVSMLWLLMPDLFYFNKEDLIVAAAKEMLPLEDVFLLDEETKGPLYEAMELYKNGSYSLAIKNFDNHLDRNRADKEVRLYKATAHLFAGKTEVAIDQLKRLQQSKDAFIERHTKWYLSLAYIKKKQLSKAKALLEQLKEDDFYREQAQKLLAQL